MTKEELETDVSYLKKMMQGWADKYFEMSDRATLAEIDRDKWKRRADALEKGLRGDCDFCVLLPLDCADEPCAVCLRSNYLHWQFDEARFLPEQEERS